MARPPELPRIDVEGERCIELHRSQPLRELKVDDVPTREILGLIVKKFESYMQLVKDFWQFQDGEPLHVLQENDDFVWAVKDSRHSSTQNKALSSRVKRFEKLVIKRTNEYAEVLKDAHNVATDSGVS